MKRTEPYKPLCFLVPVLADEVRRVYDDPEAFLIQQKHHFPLKTEKGTSSVKEYSQNTFPAQTQQVRELSHHPDCKIYSLRFFHTFSTSAQVTGGKPPSKTLGVLDDWNEPLLHSAHVASPGTENPSHSSLAPYHLLRIAVTMRDESNLLTQCFQGLVTPLCCAVAT